MNLQKLFKSNASHLFFLMMLQYAILTLNTAAIAQHNRPGLFATDILIPFLGWTIFKKCQEATTQMEKWGYILGGGIGAQIALSVGMKFFG